jgi:glutamate-1-semialdehyde 2,1-aminomutase
MSESTQSNRSLFERAQRVIPGGVNSPVRSFASVGGTPYFVAMGSGSSVTDVEGRRYLDFVQSYGASILGHAHPRIVAAIEEAAARGATFGAPTEGEVRLAEHIVGRVPGVEMVRLVSSGTEATMTAVRLARGHTGRSRIVKFDGCYHGHSDALLASAGSGVASLGISGSAGVPDSAVAETLVVPYNVVPELSQEVAAVIVEPVAANMGLVLPVDGFLEGLRAECDRVGALLIFDEVITGFRIARGGAVEYFGVQPDLVTYGKVIGGGLPIGALAGRAEVMSSLAPSGPVYQAGTLSGNPLATAAGCAVLELLDEEAYAMLHGRALQLATELAQVFAEAGVDVQVPQFSSLLGIFFSDTQVTNYSEARKSVERGLYPAFFHGMLDRGVALAPGPYEILFPSLAHSPAEIERTVDVASAVAHGMVRL